MASGAGPGGQSGSPLLEAWMKTIVHNNGRPLTDPQEIIKKMEATLRKTWEELARWLGHEGSNEIGSLCANAGGSGGSLTHEGEYLKNLCKGIAEIRYFMSGVETKRTIGKSGRGTADDDGPVYVKLTDDKAYPRCVVGAVALSDLYSDHCHLDKVIDYVSDNVEGNLMPHVGKGLDVEMIKKCAGKVDEAALFFGRSVLGDTIKEWAKGNRGNTGPGRIRTPWSYWPRVCKKPKPGTDGHDAGKKENLERNKASLVKFTVGENTQSSTSNASSTMEDILTKPELTLNKDVIKQAFTAALSNGTPFDAAALTQTLKEETDKKFAEACMKKEGQSLCERLKCAKTHWELSNNGQVQGQKGDFWEGHVKGKLNDALNTASNTGSGATSTYCNDEKLDTANKEACKLFTAKLEQIYQNKNGSVGDQLSDQIIKCVLLNAYAKKLKEEAKLKGYCDINDGIEKAFQTATNATSGNNVPCQWDENDYEKCSITTSGSSTADQVKDKVEKMLEDNPQTKDPQIQKTLSDFNTNSTLCERVKCAANWYKINKGSGGTSNDWVNKMWEEGVQKDVTSLGKDMSNNDNKTLDKHCDGLDYKKKEVCLLFAKGLHHMYNKTNNDGNDPMKLLKRTMMCAALNAYAKKLKDEAKGKTSCSIEGGISKAFTESSASMGNGVSPCTDPKSPGCFECKWERNGNFDDCSITTNGQTTGKIEVKDKLTTFLENDSTGLKESLDKICLPCLDKENLCERAECVMGRWKANGNGQPRNHPWKDGVESELTELSQKIQDKKGKVEKHCSTFKEEEKTVCEFIAAGLESIYEIKANTSGKGGKSTKKDLEDQLFKRTMRCVLLNAFADKLEALPCADEKKVKDAIDKAFLQSGNIKDQTSPCKDDGDKCFKCERFNAYKTCQIKENSSSGSSTEGENLKGKIDPILNQVDEDDTSSLTKKSLTKTICKPCTGENNGNFCQELQCVVEKLGKRKYGSPTGTTPSWESMKDDFEKELKALLDGMKKPENQKAVATKYCTADKDGNNWSERDAHGVANRGACELVAAGLKHISSIQHEYKSMGSKKPEENENPYDNQEFHQFAACLMLKSVVQKMKEQSPICYIEPGINKAFDSVKDIIGDCKNGRPCIECKLDDYDQLNDCKISDQDNDKVKPKLEALLIDNEYKTNVEETLSPITTTAGNSSSTLCLRLQCLAPRVQASNNASTFWDKEGGEVANLWTELSQAMNANGGKDNGNGHCNKVDVNRDPTNPERKACNYLHAGLRTIYNGSTASSTPSSGTISLKDNPLLRQIVGCFLLHSYAKHMKDNAKCLVESGIKKAFKVGGEILKGTCNGTEPCVPCQWDEDKYESCEININGTNKTPAKNKLQHVKDKIETTATATLTEINKMDKLCDYIKCAAPNWFKSKLPTATTGGGTPGTPTKTWCDFWNEGAKTTLQSMFQEIKEKGNDTSMANTNYATCQSFGDGNEHSVERKACNHIAEGLKYLKNKIESGNDERLQRAVGCIALNLYADQIVAKSQDKCPIDESKIQRMFDYWNRINSPCKALNNNGCFKCERRKNFNDCELSVSNTLVDTTSTQPTGQICNDNGENKKVQTQMNELLKESNNPQVKSTLSTITNMDTFCSKMQCAAKKWKAAQNKNTQHNSVQSTDVKWVRDNRNDIQDEVKTELNKILGHITDDNNWKSVAKYCKGDIGPSTDDTPGEKKAKQKACKLFASGLKHISDIKNNNKGQEHAVPLKQTMMCAALNLYADQLINKAKKQCPLDNKKLEEAINHAFSESNNIMKNGGTSCNTQGNNSCFVCNRQDKNDFANCQIGNNSNDKVGDKMTELLDKEDQSNTTKSNNNQEKTLEKINKIETFCTQVQCAIKQYGKNNNKEDQNGTVTWTNIENDAKDELTELIQHMTEGQTKGDLSKYCNKDEEWSKLGHKRSKTNKAACLLFASGLEHIYTHGNGQKNGHIKGQFNGPSFEQTMGCLFLKEYAKQLKDLAKEKKKGHSWVHPLCDIDDGINHAFGKSGEIMKESPQCKNTNDPNSCFECKLNEGYINCKIGTEEVKPKVKPLLEDNKEHMQQTLENTVCPILLTDLLTPFVPLAPVSIGLSAMAYYLWKYFGPLGKGGPRFRRSPTEIPGPSVQEQVLDHVQQDSSHEYQLVKERKPRSAPTRTKRSGRVNRRTIIEIHFEVLDECQKGDTQLNQKDFLELLVQEFMGSEFMEEEHVPMEEVLMEAVPMESVPMELVPIEEVPSLGSGLLV
ncbi:SICAvar type I [Plasmodium knowlesi]|uniref:SICAvar type I n=1 Tax=Plasmodium knowlesi TaxID=5850 RepID=A0A1Y3DLZ7_PLAKN|nr:SICAvar type I [Plasmodium knowlesi]